MTKIDKVPASFFLKSRLFSGIYLIVIFLFLDFWLVYILRKKNVQYLKYSLNVQYLKYSLKYFSYQTVWSTLELFSWGYFSLIMGPKVYLMRKLIWRLCYLFDTLFFLMSKFYRNIEAQIFQKNKNIVVILYVVITLSFPASAKKGCSKKKSVFKTLKIVQIISSLKNCPIIEL